MVEISLLDLLVVSVIELLSYCDLLSSELWYNGGDKTAERMRRDKRATWMAFLASLIRLDIIRATKSTVSQ
jgi:hypothetical protein